MTPEEQRAYDEWYASVRARVEAGDVRGALQDVPRIAGLEPAAPRPLRRPLSESTVALVTSAGMSAPGQPPMDGLNFEGDYTIRVLDIDQPSAGLVISHTHFETGPAEEDINIVYPIDRLKELAADGVIGR